MDARPITIGVVDNDRFALSAMNAYLRQVIPEDMSVAWLTDSPQAALMKCSSREHPDILLVDMSMNDIDGPSLIHMLRERDARLWMIAVTSFPIDEYAQDAADAGAQGIVSKSDFRTLRQSILDARLAKPGMSGELHFPIPQAAFERLAKNPKTGLELLTGREIEIIELCRRGNTSADIAQQIGLTTATVNTYLQRACEKLGAKNRIQLVSMWVELSRSKH